MNSTRIVLLAFILIVILLSCTSEPSEQATTTPALPGDTTHITSVGSRRLTTEAEDTFSGDTTYPVKVLLARTFHGDEIWKNVEQEKWFGLFKGPEGYYLAATPVQAKRIYDPVQDNNSIQKTGWEITVSSPDSSLILLAGLTALKNRTVPFIPLPKHELLPNDSLSIDFQGIRYMLYATGQKQNGEITDYQLYLKMIYNNQITTDLLIKHDAFDDNMVKILFIGDIDGDNKLDLLLDTSHHYNGFIPTLYLSSSAEAGHAVKLAGLHRSFGC